MGFQLNKLTELLHHDTPRNLIFVEKIYRSVVTSIRESFRTTIAFVRIKKRYFRHSELNSLARTYVRTVRMSIWSESQQITFLNCAEKITNLRHAKFHSAFRWKTTERKKNVSIFHGPVQFENPLHIPNTLSIGIYDELLNRF